MRRRTKLCIDIGTTWAKLAVLEIDEDSYQILYNNRIVSNVGDLVGSVESIQSFLDLYYRIQLIVSALIRDFPIESIGLTGIREGLVFVDANNTPLWISGNCLLEHVDFVGLKRDPNKASEPIYWFPRILCFLPKAESFLTLQGFIALKLTNRRCITQSELSALGMNGRTSSDLMAFLHSKLKFPSIFPVGRCISSHCNYPDISIHLGGADEQASFFGAGIGRGRELAISTGSFWAIASKENKHTSFPNYFRYTPSIPPFVSTISIVGYKWGIYLHQISNGIKPEVPSNLPDWAKGKFVKYLQNTMHVSIEDVVTLISEDIKWAIGELSIYGTFSNNSAIALCGGGVLNNYLLIQNVMNRVGHPWRSLEVDASQLGCFYAIDNDQC